MVIETEEVHDGGMEITDVDGIGADTVAEFIGFAVGDAGFHSAASHSDCEGIGIVIASDESVRRATAAVFLHGSATELTAPDHQGILQHTAHFEIC